MSEIKPFNLVSSISSNARIEKGKRDRKIKREVNQKRKEAQLGEMERRAIPCVKLGQMAVNSPLNHSHFSIDGSAAQFGSCSFIAEASQISLGSESSLGIGAYGRKCEKVQLLRER
jgi:hypothetical protein